MINVACKSKTFPLQEAMCGKKIDCLCFAATGCRLPLNGIIIHVSKLQLEIFKENRKFFMCSKTYSVQSTYYMTVCTEYYMSVLIQKSL